MSEHNKTTFWRLLSRQKIVIPIQQRDYAQGRRGKEYLRHRFLLELKSALDDENKSLTLDFVYGVANADNSIAPLDGQQRLTTLWLLHWYIAFWRGQLAKEEVKNGQLLKHCSFHRKLDLGLSSSHSDSNMRPRIYFQTGIYADSPFSLHHETDLRQYV